MGKRLHVLGRAFLVYAIMACLFPEAWCEKTLPHLYLDLDQRGAVYLHGCYARKPVWADKAEEHFSGILGGDFEVVDFGQGERFWHIEGGCPSRNAKQGLVVRTTLPVHGLLLDFAESGTTKMDFEVGFPDVPFAHVDPPGAELAHEDEERWYWYEEIDPRTFSPTVSVEYGYRATDVAKMFGGAGLPLFAAVLLLVWQRSRTFRRAERIGNDAWFSFFAWLAVVVLLGWIASCGAYIALEGSWFLEFVYPTVGLAAWLNTLLTLLKLLASFLPLVALSVIAMCIGHPVQKQLRQLTITRRETVVHTVAFLAMIILPLVVLGTGIEASDYSPATALLVVCAYVLFLVLKRVYMYSLGVTFETLAHGELHLRIKALASQAGVALGGVKIMIGGRRFRMANAVAMAGNQIVLADYLVENLTKRECDAVVAHELSHVKNKHVRKRLAAYSCFVACSAVCGALSGIALGFGWPVFVAATLIFLAFLACLYGYYRRQERVADLEGARLTGDPEGMISGLAKVHRLNRLPFQWARGQARLLSHPSLTRRVRQIAEAHHIDESRVAEIVADQGPIEDHYDLPADLFGQGIVAATAAKSRNALACFWITRLLLAVGPTFAACVASRAGLDWAGQCVVVALGICMTVVLTVAAGGYVALLGNRKFRARLRARLAKKGLDPADWSGGYVLLTPGGQLRIFDGFTNWDIGFLAAMGNRLCYIGDKTRFSLDRNAVTTIQVHRERMGWGTTQRVKVGWRDPATEETGEMILLPASRSSLGRCSIESARLAVKLQDWHAGAESGGIVASKELPPLPSPSFRDVEGVPLAHLLSRSSVQVSMVMQAIVALILCMTLSPWVPAERTLFFVLAAVGSMIAQRIYLVPWLSGMKKRQDRP